MLRLLCIYSILNTQYSFYGASPLIGKAVRVANLEEFPFIVSLSRKTNEVLEEDELTHFCGGSLITTTHVFTAAHCLLNRQLDNIVVKVGSIDLRKTRVYGIEWWLTYSQWAGKNLPRPYNADIIYNIAIIKLRDAALDIELPTTSYIPDKDLYDKSAVTGGWGLIEENKQPRYMRVATFIIKSPEECEPLLNLTDLFVKDILPKLNLCTAPLSDASISCGDGGSPLLHGDNNIVGVSTAYCALTSNATYTIISSKNIQFDSSVNAYAQFIEEVKRK